MTIRTSIRVIPRHRVRALLSGILRVILYGCGVSYGSFPSIPDASGTQKKAAAFPAASP